DYLATIALNLDHVERRSCGNSQTLALSHREIVNAGVFTNYFAVGAYEFTRGIRQRFALLGEIGIEKGFVVSAGNKTNLLRIRLLRQGQTMLAGELTNLRFGHSTQRE